MLNNWLYNPGSTRHYETMMVNSKGERLELLNYNWYHGKITEEEADIALSRGNTNTFLVRQSGHHLILSQRIRGYRSHNIIHCNPGGYRLDGKEDVFKTVPEMVAAEEWPGFRTCSGC